MSSQVRPMARTNAAPRPIRRRNVSQEIAAKLAQDIALGRYKPGERLRSERDLCEEFDVSRSSVREAIKTLESRGLVEGRQGEGTFVRRQGLDMLVQLPAAPVSVNEVEVQHLYEVREMLEPPMARRAAERATAADVAALCRLMERQERLVEQGRYTSQDDARFHLKLAAIAGNPVLTRLLEGVMHLLGVVREPALRAASTAGLRVTLARHWQILRAVEAHDPDTAERHAREHLSGALATAIKVIRELEGRAANVADG